MAIDSNLFAQAYGGLLTKGKELGLEGAQLQSFIDTGISSGQKGELETLADRFFAARREERDPAYRKQVLEDQLAFDRQRMQEAAKYKAIFDLPKTLIEAYSVPAQIQAQGASNIAQMMSQNSQNIPSLINYQRSAFGFNPNQYRFG
jgi:hypothetical protein